MKHIEILTIDDLKKFCWSYSKENFDNGIYDKLSFEEYKKDYEKHLKSLKEYKLLIWHKYIRKLPLISSFVMRFTGIARDKGYFKEPPFYLNYSRTLIGIKNIVEVLDSEPFMSMDAESLKCIYNILMFRLTYDYKFLNNIYEKDQPQYFDHNIVKSVSIGTFVDCGAFIGDTIESFLSEYQDFDTIYAFEPDETNYELAKNNLKKLLEEGRIILIKKGVSNLTQQLFFTSDGAASRTSDSGTITIEVASLDEAITNKVDFIKMDIEGSELFALQGARQHIIHDNPILTICIYHKPDDIKEITQYIYGINSNYNFYIRHYYYKESETVLYCIPK